MVASSILSFAINHGGLSGTKNCISRTGTVVYIKQVQATNLQLRNHPLRKVSIIPEIDLMVKVNLLGVSHIPKEAKAGAKDINEPLTSALAISVM